MATMKTPLALCVLCKWFRGSSSRNAAFPFTSMPINVDFSRRRHSDSGDAGKNMIKVLGSFNGGRVRAWRSDDRVLKVENLPSSHAEIMDISEWRQFDENSRR